MLHVPWSYLVKEGKCLFPSIKSASNLLSRGSPYEAKSALDIRLAIERVVGYSTDERSVVLSLCALYSFTRNFGG